MLKIPYVKQPDHNSCALASYTMVAKHFFPKVTFDQLARVSDWQKGYVIWAFKFWLWIMNKGIKVTEYDTLDYESWANQGIEGLKKSVSEKEFNFYTENTRDIISYSQDIKMILKHQNFTLLNEKPTFEILEEAIKDSRVCEVVLDSRTLRGREGFSLHRVVVLDIKDNEVIFHDPAFAAYTRADKETFVNAWLKAVSEPELCIYERVS